MKFLIFAAMLLCSSADLYDFQKTEAPITSNYLLEATVAGGSIIMEDDIMMRVDTEDGNKTIVSIGVCSLASGQNVLSVEGCGASVCLVNLSSLDNGSYQAHAVDNTGQTISATVTVSQ